MIDYQEFLERKIISDPPTGLTNIPELNAGLMPFQRDIVAWALRRGRAAIFADCGMGKTLMQLEWAHRVPGRVLILAPLAVASQTVREAAKFNIPDVAYCRDQSQVSGKITIANYEMLDHFDPSEFGGIVLDESSILKAYDGKFRNQIISSFHETPYRLACTATPAPNDLMELTNHSEFLGTMGRSEMLAMFFIHDGGDTAKWRLKRHGQRDFWKWVASWAVMLRKPSDIGYSDEGFILPPLKVHQITVDAKASTSTLFPMEALTLQERLTARRDSTPDRVRECAALVNGTTEQWLIWCNLNSESAALKQAIDGAVEIVGADSPDSKESAMRGFIDGTIRVLVTKPTIAGFGMNFQNCHKMAFVGLSDSYEQYYQAMRRCWRFGQTMPVDVYVVTAETEGAVVSNINRKERDASTIAEGIVQHMKDINTANLHGGQSRSVGTYEREVKSGDDAWTVHLGDCVEVAREIPTDSLHYTIYSPPFASLYTYSNSERDMGNTKDIGSFMDHYRFLVAELYRATMPGRLVSFHCMNLPSSKQTHGQIGIHDFRGELIREHVAAGFIFHSEVVIWKDPVTAMQRTKALGLLHKQIRKDSCMSRQGIPDYVVTMRKPGDNPERVGHTKEEFPVGLWQRYASPVWMDIDPSDTLQRTSARGADDERHICPLQLEVIRRCVRLWSATGDTIFSPFTGIGSEGVVALEMGRKFIGAELKRSYWQQACANLGRAARQESLELFAGSDDEVEVEA